MLVVRMKWLKSQNIIQSSEYVEGLLVLIAKPMVLMLP